MEKQSFYSFQGDLIKGTIVKRPSKINKSPYVADVLVNGEEFLAHSPSLGLSGLIAPNVEVLLLKKSESCKTQYSIEYVFVTEQPKSLVINTRVGSNPNLSNKLVYNMIKSNSLPGFPVLDMENTLVKPEHKLGNSRIDIFVNCTNGKKYYLEIKTVPIGFYNNHENRKECMVCQEGQNYNDKVAIFPDGYRKSKNEPMSPRALKHIDELVTIREKEPNTEIYMVYVVPRMDCKYFSPSKLDTFYNEKLTDAFKNKNLNIIAFSTYMENGNVYFHKSLENII
jgi:DNA-binding sugar fermentation-stimulating protein